MKTTEFDERFDAGEDMSAHIDWSKARRLNVEAKRVNVDFPTWVVSTSFRKAKANEFAANVLPIILNLQSSGLSLRQMAVALNERNVSAARGGKWQATTVRNILARADHLGAAT